MVETKVIQSNGGTIIQLKGHAKDPLVCSAISAITDTYILGLQAIQESYPNEINVNYKEVNADEKDSSK